MSEPDRTEALIKAAEVLSWRKSQRALAVIMLVLASLGVILTLAGMPPAGCAPEDPQRPLIIAVNLFAACLAAAPALWFLASPGRASNMALPIGIVFSLTVLVAAQVFAVSRGARLQVGGLLLSAGYLLFWLIQTYHALKYRAKWGKHWTSPPPTGDLQEVECLARQAANADPDREGDIVALRIKWRSVKIRLADVALLVWGKGGRIEVAHKEDVCYVLATPKAKCRKPMIALYLKGRMEDEDEPFWLARLSPAALARLMAWKAPERRLILARTYWHSTRNWVLKPPSAEKPAGT